MEEIAASHSMTPGEVVVVGDSITDSAMLGRVRDVGGIAIVFNGNEYAVPYANIALCGTDIGLVWGFANAHACGGGAIELACRLEQEYRDDPRVDSLVGADADKIATVVEAHKRFRKLVRGEAAKLG
jgi:energy-converting hydrogenase A subunit R